MIGPYIIFTFQDGRAGAPFDCRQYILVSYDGPSLKASKWTELIALRIRTEQCQFSPVMRDRISSP